MCPVFAFLDNPVTLLILGALAVLLFGDRLPEVARSFGKTFVELRNGLQGIQREIENAVNSTPPAPTLPEYQEAKDHEAVEPPTESPPSSQHLP